MLIHMLPHLASRRACANSKIEIKALKSVMSFSVYIGNNGEDKEKVKKDKKDAKDRFWRVMESFSHNDR